MNRIIFIFSTCLLLICNINVTRAQVALAFNGVNNYVSTNGSPVLNNQARTVDAWIKTTSTVSTQMVICDWGSTTPNASRFTLNTIAGKLRIEVGGVGIIGTTSVNTGQWTHVSAVYDPAITSGPNVFLYINGLLELSGNFTGYPTLTTTTTVGFRIGVRTDGINFFNGAIDEVKVYNYARTQAQIAADTMEVCAPLAGLVAYYRLNEGVPNATNSGSTATDYSGSGNNGTLNSFTLSGTVSNWVTGRVRSSSPTISVSPGTNICSGNTLTLSTNASSGYTWSTGSTTSTLITLSPTVSTTYSISTTNSLNCVSVSTLAVTVNTAAPSVTVVTAQSTICPGMSTSFTASGAPSYTWSGGLVNGQAFTPTATTAYTLVAGNGCGVSSSVYTITVAPLQVSALASSSIVCQNYTCNLTATSSVNGYTWLPGSQTGTSIVVSPQATTVYTVTASNGSCVATQTIQVTTLTTPTIVPSNSVILLCDGQSASVSVSGAGLNGTYTWSPGGNNGVLVVLNPTSTTAYTVSGTNSLGCTASAQFPVVIQNTPAISILTSNTLVCLGDALNLSASGAATYTWSTGANTASVNVTPGSGLTTYSVAGTSSVNTCVSTQTIDVAVITPSVNYTSSISLCTGNSATLNANGANSYTWNSIPTGTIGFYVVTPSITSTYSLVAITQSLNTQCLSTGLATVFVNPLPTLSLSSSRSLLCKGETATITVSGANSYTWGGGSNLSSISVSPTITTVYTVTGKDANGCQNTALITQSVNACAGIATALNSNFEIRVYPNPNKGKLFIEVPMVNKNDELIVYNNLGNLLYRISVTETKTLIDISNVPAGIYFVHLLNSDKANRVIKVIKE